MHSAIRVVVSIVVVILMVFGIACRLHSPDLTPTMAGEIISRTPEFSHTRKLVQINNTTRGVDSLDYCCYDAEFTFTLVDSNKPDRAAIKAYAGFRYWDGSWHLQEFYYGSPPQVETVWITSDIPKSP
jgi:hypothetical protein